MRSEVSERKVGEADQPVEQERGKNRTLLEQFVAAELGRHAARPLLVEAGALAIRQFRISGPRQRISRVQHPLDFEPLDARFAPRTRNTRLEQAAAWWTVDDVVLSPEGTVYYRIRGSVGREPVDDRGRTVLEAFGSLPMQAMAENLESYLASLRDAAGRWDDLRALSIIAPLASFVRTFGPVGIGWGMKFRVTNPEVEKLRRDLDRTRGKAVGQEAEAADGRAKSRLAEAWTISFWGHGPGRETIPTVRREISFPGDSWDERIRLGDQGLARDLWPRIVDEQRDLLRALELAEAVSQRQAMDCRTAIQYFLGDDPTLWIGEARPFQVEYGRAYRGIRRDRFEKLLQLPSHQVDWVLLGGLVLADLIARQIDFAMPAVDISGDGGFETRWQAASLLEVMYLELLDHMRKRPDFGVGRCGACGGPILRIRRPGVTGNQWHRGCRGGRVGKWRAEHPDWRSRRAPTDR